MLAFIIFVGFLAHVLLAHLADSLLDDLDSTGWYKSKYRKFLLIPGLAEIILVILAMAVTGTLAYVYTIDLFKDFKD
jgi:hypothetical protein